MANILASLIQNLFIIFLSLYEKIDSFHICG